jgi:hypothetical protein
MYCSVCYYSKGIRNLHLQCLYTVGLHAFRISPTLGALRGVRGEERLSLHTPPVLLLFRV